MVCCVVMSGAAPARAQSTSTEAGETETRPRPDDEQARAHFEAGGTAYTEGRFEDALRLFRRAYELSARPEMLYNIGQSLDRLRRDQEALDAFEAYLGQEPDTPHRPQVERRIAILRRGLGQEPESDGGAIHEQWWFWTILAVVLVGAGLGVGLGVGLSQDTVQEPFPGTGGRVIFALDGS